MSKTYRITHGSDTSNSEFTMCGDAFDLDAIGDPEAPAPRFAAQGEVVTCEKCRALIAYCKKFKRFRVPNNPS